MSWLFRSHAVTRSHAAISHGPRGTIHRGSRAARAACAIGAAVLSPSFAAQTFVQPTVSVTAENDTNLDLDPGPPQNVQGYEANASALMGVTTQTTDSIVLARLDYRDYPKDTPDDRLEGFLDFRSDYTTQLSHASISGIVDHRDEFNAQLSSATFDEINPIQPTNPTTGRALTGESLTNVLLMPSYAYKLSPLLGVSGTLVYQKLMFTPSILGLEDFNYYQGKGSLDWSYSARSQLSFGGFGSYFDSTQAGSHAQGAGASVEWDTNWTQLFSTNAAVSYQRTDTDYHQALGDFASPEENAQINSWGANINALYKTQLSQYRLSLQRMVTPSAAGGMYMNNQGQFQYTREFSQRLTFTGAMIYLKNSELPINLSKDDRKYLQTLVDVKWMIAPTWFIQCGYQYFWEKYTQETNSAANNRVYVRVGYQGRPPQR
jgi:hypothetical protein